jgi:putative RecB family exonuclease
MVATAGTGDNDTDALPSRLSPSRLSDFKQCPAKFYFGSIVRLPRPATEATTVGTLAHEAFEHVFDHPRGERTVEIATSYVKPAWEKIREQPNYVNVAHLGDELVERAEHMVRSWFGMENPEKFDPIGREMKVISEMAGVPLLGILDRVDRLTVNGEQRLYISDYKTGKPPRAGDRFMEEKFFAMRAYALLWHTAQGEMPHELRLVFVAGGTKEHVHRKKVDENMLRATREELKGLVKAIKRSAELGTWECKQQPLCQWCDFIDLCPQWHPELAGMPVGEIKRRYEGDVSLFD